MKYLSSGSGNAQRRRAGIAKLLACVIFAASAFIPGTSTPGASTAGAYAPPPPATVTVNDDGTFTPYEITIKQGEKIKWEGLDPTDSIVQISGPKLVIPIPDPGGIKDNIRDHAYAASDPNEFTGPMRKGVSGIFVLGPTTRGFVQKPADKDEDEDCNCEAKNQPQVLNSCGSGMRTPDPCDPAEV